MSMCIPGCRLLFLSFAVITARVRCLTAVPSASYDLHTEIPLQPASPFIHSALSSPPQYMRCPFQDVRGVQSLSLLPEVNSLQTLLMCQMHVSILVILMSGMSLNGSATYAIQPSPCSLPLTPSIHRGHLLVGKGPPRCALPPLCRC